MRACLVSTDGAAVLGTGVLLVSGGAGANAETRNSMLSVLRSLGMRRNARRRLLRMTSLA